MNARTSVMWTPEFLTYQLSDDHPLNPVRLDSPDVSPSESQTSIVHQYSVPMIPPHVAS